MVHTLLSKIKWEIFFKYQIQVLDQINFFYRYIFFVQVTEQELIDFVAKNMMDHCRLRAGVKFVDNFPYTISGKILKRDLKAMTKKLIKHDE